MATLNFVNKQEKKSIFIFDAKVIKIEVMARLDLIILTLTSIYLITGVSGLREFESGQLSKYSSCPFLNGLYTSVMRRIYNPGFHK